MTHDLSQIPSERCIRTQRTIPFAAEQVFEAFREPTVLAKWWGPTGFTNTFDEFDFRDGGMWRFTMHSPDGKDYANESRFVKIVEPTTVVMDHLCQPHFQAQFAFEDTSDGCRIDWHMVFEDAQTRDNVAKFAGDANEQNLDRLVEQLGKSNLKN